jgi:hypothetical protein
MLLQNFNRIVAWLMLSVIVVLTVVPPGLRPSTFVPHIDASEIVRRSLGLQYRF